MEVQGRPVAKVGTKDAGVSNDTITAGPARAPLVYLVEDDSTYREELIFGLTKFGIEIQGFANATGLYRAFSVRSPDVVVLDIRLEGEDGLSIAYHLQSASPVGIIILTAHGSIEDRVSALDRGAHIYLTKPIEIQDLGLLIIALARKINDQRHISPYNQVSKWSLKEGGWILEDGNGNRMRLTTAERKFLGRLFQDVGKTFDRSDLVEAIGGDIYDFNYTNLDTLVSRLRRRAKKMNMQLPLHAVRGAGFTFSG